VNGKNTLNSDWGVAVSVITTVLDTVGVEVKVAVAVTVDVGEGVPVAAVDGVGVAVGLDGVVLPTVAVMVVVGVSDANGVDAAAWTICPSWVKVSLGPFPVSSEMPA
jgi:hypothetical protein